METVIQVTLNVTVTTPESGTLKPIDLVNDGLKEAVIPVPSYAPCGYSISGLEVKGLVEKES
jgi:hypothetical protein